MKREIRYQSNGAAAAEMLIHLAGSLSGGNIGLPGGRSILPLLDALGERIALLSDFHFFVVDDQYFFSHVGHPLSKP